MKKFLALLAAVILTFTLAGCGEYVTPVEPVTPVVPVEPGKPEDPGKDPTDPEKEQPFTVSLTYLGQPFAVKEPINAQWNDLETGAVYSKPLNSNGFAEIEGLDGDYRVTLSGVPDGYTYNPNDDKHIATNDEKNVTISLYFITETTGTGASFTNGERITLTTIGAYRATLNSPEHKIHYFYTPRTSGDYSITSLIDTTANVINPILDIYTANSGGYTLFRETRDGGGYENTFTKNFKWEIGLSDDEVGGCFGFVIRTDSLNDDAYPINIDFILDKDGEFSGAQPIEYVPVPVTEEFIEVPLPSADMTFNFAACLKNNKELDSDFFRLYSKAEGGDGYYHFYDRATNTYGATLYAKVSQSSEVMDAFTNPLVRKQTNGKDYSALVAAYADHANKNPEGGTLPESLLGVYPVTEEFKAWLNDYANAQYLFNDGNGMAEVYNGYNSTLEDQWLFACGFYTTGGRYNLNGTGGVITDIR